MFSEVSVISLDVIRERSESRSNISAMRDVRCERGMAIESESFRSLRLSSLGIDLDDKRLMVAVVNAHASGLRLEVSHDPLLGIAKFAAALRHELGAAESVLPLLLVRQESIRNFGGFALVHVSLANVEVISHLTEGELRFLG
jgi:hypothetical protein